jgi:hypothetical protein
MPSPPRASDERDQRRMTGRRRADEDYEDEYEERDDRDEEEADRAERGGGAAPRRQARHPREGRQVRPQPQALSAPLAARAAVQHVQDLTGKPASGVTSLERADDGWLVGVEVVEDRRIPSTTDILAVYMTQITVDGSLESYYRARRYQRGRGDREGEPG